MKYVLIIKSHIPEIFSVIFFFLYPVFFFFVNVNKKINKIKLNLFVKRCSFYLFPNECKINNEIIMNE
jgi:hypothetical protein